MAFSEYMNFTIYKITKSKWMSTQMDSVIWHFFCWINGKCAKMFVIYDGSPYWASIHPRQNFSREKSFLSSISCVLYHYHCHVDKKFRRKNSFFKIKATGPGVVYFVWKNVSCTYFLFNRALSSLRFWNSIIPYLTTTFEKKIKIKSSLWCSYFQYSIVKSICSKER